MPNSHIYWFREISKEDLRHIGEKGVKLGELKRSGVSIPDGFVISSEAFDKFIKENDLDRKARHLIKTANHKDPNSLKQVSNHIYKYFHEGKMSSDFKLDLFNSYKKLSGKLTDLHVKVMPSTSTHTHSIKKNKYEEVKGEASLIHHIKDYWASNYSEINLINNSDSSFVKSIIVQKSIEPDKSGKAYTIHPETYDKNQILIKSMLGHFDDQVNLVSMPDYYVINKSDHSILEREETEQKRATKGKGTDRKKVLVSKSHAKNKKLNTNEIEKIAKEAKLAEKVSYFPQEIDWIAEGENIYLIHTKPIN